MQVDVGGEIQNGPSCLRSPSIEDRHRHQNRAIPGKLKEHSKGTHHANILKPLYARMAPMRHFRLYQTGK